jgi:hypothetical protein
MKIAVHSGALQRSRQIAEWAWAPAGWWRVLPLMFCVWASPAGAQLSPQTVVHPDAIRHDAHDEALSNPYAWVGAHHNAVLHQLRTADTQPDWATPAGFDSVFHALLLQSLAITQAAYPQAVDSAGLLPVLAYAPAYSLQLSQRHELYRILALTPRQIQYLEALFAADWYHTELAAADPQAAPRLTTAEAHATAQRYLAQREAALLNDPRLTTAERTLPLLAFAIARASYEYWVAYPPRDTFRDDSDTNRPKTGRVVKADVFGLMKGVLGGLAIYVLGDFFGVGSEGLRIGLGSGVALAWPAVDSLLYVRRYKKGLRDEFLDRKDIEDEYFYE